MGFCFDSVNRITLLKKLTFFCLFYSILWLLALFMYTASNIQTLEWTGNSWFICSLSHSTEQHNMWVPPDFTELICRTALKLKMFSSNQFIFTQPECRGYAQTVKKDKIYHLVVLYLFDAKPETTFAHHFRGALYQQFLPASARLGTPHLWR